MGRSMLSGSKEAWLPWRAGCLGGVVVLGAIGWGVAPALAQANQPTTLVAFQHAGLDGLALDERDAGLVGALRMVPLRLKEIHAASDIQREQEWLTPDLIDLGWDLFTQPMRMIVTNRGADPNTGQPLIGAVVSVKMRDEGSARSYHRRVLGFAREQAVQAGLEITDSRRIRTMSDISTPMGPLSFGPREAADGWRYEILFASAPGPDRAFESMPALDDGTTTASFVMDLGAISPLVQPFLGLATMAMPAGQGQQMIEQLGAAGLIGPNAIRIEMASGFTPTHSVLRTKIINARRHADGMGLSLVPLRQEAIGMLPKDTTACIITTDDPLRRWERVRSQLGPMVRAMDDFVAQFREMTGVDLVDDVISTMGDTAAVYLSDSTGGGSLMSAAYIATVKDGPRLSGAVRKLAASANRYLGESPSPDTIGFRIESVAMGDGNLLRFRADGLPVPLMPSFAVVGGHMAAGLTPQACAAAIAQPARRATDSLLGNAAFAENMGAFRGPITIGFVDTARTMKDGYGLVQMGATALETFVSSPYGTRIAPQVLPMLPELRANARPMLQITSWEGEDLIVVQTADRSVLVTLCGVLGVGDAAPLIIGGAIGSGITAAIMQFVESPFGRGDWEGGIDEQWWMDDDDDDVDF